MIASYSLLLILFNFAIATWINNVVKRTIFLNSPVVREDLLITATPPSPDAKYMLAIPSDRYPCHWKALRIDTTAKIRKDLEMEELEFGSKEYMKYCHGDPKSVKITRCFWISGFKEAGFDTSKPITFSAGVAYRGAFRPIPKENKQNAELKVIFESSAYWYSPYQTEKQKTSFTLPRKFKLIKASCPKPHSLDKPASGSAAGTVQYSCGVYGKPVGPFETSKEPLRVQMTMNDIAFGTVESMHREITVLPWFNLVQVDEKWTIHHDGFQTEAFDRGLLLRAIGKNESVQYIWAWPFLMPKSAYDVEVRDENGKLTGQSQRGPSAQSPDSMDQLVVSPRYPLMGGWTYSFEFSYKLPFNRFHIAEKNIHQLMVPLYSMHFDMAIRKFTLRFNLPEDAEIFDYSYGGVHSNQIEETSGTYKTYFSSKGEQYVELELKDIVKDHIGPIVVRYSYPWWGIFRKPLIILLTAIIGIICFRLGTKFDLSISGRNSKSSPDSIKKDIYSKFKDRREILANIDDTINISNGKPKQDKLLQDLDKVTENILKQLRTLQSIDISISLYGASLKKLYEEHTQCIKMVLAQGKEASRLEKDAIELDKTILKYESKLFSQ